MFYGQHSPSSNAWLHGGHLSCITGSVTGHTEGMLQPKTAKVELFFPITHHDIK